MSQVSRRRLLLSAPPLLLVNTTWATPLADDLQDIITDYFAGQTAQPGPVEIDLPALSENGNSVAVSVTVDQNTLPGGVKTVTLFAQKNPIKQMASFHFPPPPPAQFVKVASRIRLADSQTVLAVAQTYDDQLLYGTADIIVTLAACVNLS